MATSSRISKIFTKEDDSVPILVNYQNGILLPREASKMFAGIYSIEEKKNVITASKEFLYRGELEKDDSNMTVTLVAVRNKKTNKVCLIEVDKCTLSTVLDEVSVDEAEREMDYSKINSNLNKTFGSKRSKCRTEQRERIQLNVDIMKEHLEATAKNTKIDNADIAIPAEDKVLTDILPVINTYADSVDEIYNLSDIIRNDEMESLQEEVDRVLECNEDAIQTGQVIKKQILLLQKSMLPLEKKKTKCAIYLYIDILNSWLHEKYNAVKQHQHKACQYSEIVNYSVLRKFSMSSMSGRVRPSSINDKLAAHIIVLIMIVFDYTVELEFIVSVLGYTDRKVTEIARLLRASVCKINSSPHIVLKLPLPPAVSVFRKVMRQAHKK